MDKITDFFKEIKERLSNPFISSFIISWLLTNWKLTIAVLTYSREDYKTIGYNGFIDFARDAHNYESLFWWPFFIALGYTFVWPFFRTIILAFSAWINKESTLLNKKITKESKISMRKYLSLRDDYDVRTEKLEKIIDKESETSEENRTLKTELFETREKLTSKEVAYTKVLSTLNELNTTRESITDQFSFFKKESEKEIEKLKSTNNDLKKRIELKDILFTNSTQAANPSFMDGAWLFFRYNYDNNIEEQNINIKDSEIFNTDTINARSIEKIIFFYINKQNRTFIIGKTLRGTKKN